MTSKFFRRLLTFEAYQGQCQYIFYNFVTHTLQSFESTLQLICAHVFRPIKPLKLFARRVSDVQSGMNHNVIYANAAINSEKFALMTPSLTYQTAKLEHMPAITDVKYRSGSSFLYRSTSMRKCDFVRAKFKCYFKIQLTTGKNNYSSKRN